MAGAGGKAPAAARRKKQWKLTKALAFLLVFVFAGHRQPPCRKLLFNKQLIGKKNLFALKFTLLYANIMRYYPKQSLWINNSE